MGDIVRMRRKVKLALGEDVADALPQMLRDGYIEIARYQHGEPIYRLTKKGNARAAKLVQAARQPK